MGAWLRTAGVLASAGALVLGAWWTSDRDQDVLRLRGADLVAEDGGIVQLEEVTARLADGWSAEVQVAVVSGQPEQVRGRATTATGAIQLALSRLEHHELVGPDNVALLRQSLLEALQTAVPDAEVERVLVTGLVVS
jgi:hypothetical protein